MLTCFANNVVCVVDCISHFTARFAYESKFDRWVYHNRFIGIFIYLNTIEGSGETVFYDGHHVEEAKPMLTVPAKQGSMVLFDFIDNPIHEGKPVVDNSKWFLGTYFHVRGWRDV